MDLLDIDITLPRRSFELRAALSLGSETVAVVGPSGAGKTSLLRAIAGLDRPRAGRIALGRKVWLDAGRGVHLSPEHRQVGYLPQDYGLFPHLTVAGNVAFPGRRERPDLLVRLGIQQLADVRPAHLSGGERQRVALARALARDPRVLLLDEPFGALDSITRRQVRDELAEILSGLALPTLIVTHAFDDSTVLAGRIGVMDQGRVVQLAPATELVAHPETALVAELTGANVLDGVASPAERGGTLVRLSGGGELLASASGDGAVQIAVHPWAIRLSDPARSGLTGRVLSVRADRGILVVRLDRLTVHVPANGGGSAELGSLVGLSVAPSDVHIIPTAPEGAIPTS